jgi:unsaturated chondroitin disaccharide hydrolase
MKKSTAFSFSRTFFLIFLVSVFSFLMYSCQKTEETTQVKCINPDEYIKYCEKQLRKSVENLSVDSGKLPRSIENGEVAWRGGKSGWTVGFYPGILWYMYEATGDNYWREKAHAWSMLVEPNRKMQWKDHDLGFMMYCSLGNGYRLTQDTAYKAAVIEAADTLSTLYNPQVGTILSWPWMKRKKGWPHNTIIDNMMNLEMLFWVAKTTGNDSYYKIAESHALVTMKNHFRPDYTSYHVVVYDSASSTPLQRITFQGYADSSMWARGQAWGIYGFTMVYRETKNKEFLDFAQKIADAYITRLPEDYIPYWDFMAPNIPNEEKDASAAAITASALIELSSFMPTEALKQKYWQAAMKMLTTLSSPAYLAQDKNHAFLLHSVGFKPAGSEIDVPIIYADYYYLEALLRAKNAIKANPELCKQ